MNNFPMIVCEETTALDQLELGWMSLQLMLENVKTLK